MPLVFFIIKFNLVRLTLVNLMVMIVKQLIHFIYNLGESHILTFKAQNKEKERINLHIEKGVD